MLFLHSDIKDATPEVYVRLREGVPNLHLRREDPDVGWTYRPNHRSQGVNEEGAPYDHTTTAEGFYTPDVPDAGAHQLVTLGDSFMATFVSPEPAAWVLRERVGLPVYNLAVGGWGPENYLAAYEKFARDRRHSWVLVVTFINDITDVINWRAWQANSRGLSYMAWIQRENPDREAVNDADGWLDRHSVAWNLARFAARPALARQTGGGTSMVSVAGAAAPYTLQLIEGQVFTTHDPPAFQPGGSYYPFLGEYFESLERLRLAIEARGARMALAWVPSKERVYLPLLSSADRARFVSNASGDIGGIEPVIAQYAAQARVPFLDLTAPLSAAARREQVYFSLDGHLNGRGNQLLGALAAEFMSEVASGAITPAEPAGVLPYRSGVVDIQAPLDFASTVARSPLAVVAGRGFSVAGVADSQFGYVAQWPDRDIDTPMFVLARGRLRKGGFTLGVLRDGAWAGTVNVTVPGAFDVALPVMTPGRYTVTVAHALPPASRDTDFEITGIGWSPIAGAMMGGTRVRDRR